MFINVVLHACFVKLYSGLLRGCAVTKQNGDILKPTENEDAEKIYQQINEYVDV